MECVDSKMESFQIIENPKNAVRRIPRQMPIWRALQIEGSYLQFRSSNCAAGNVAGIRKIRVHRVIGNSNPKPVRFTIHSTRTWSSISDPFSVSFRESDWKWLRNRWSSASWVDCELDRLRITISYHAMYSDYPDSCDVRTSRQSTNRRPVLRDLNIHVDNPRVHVVHEQGLWAGTLVSCGNCERHAAVLRGESWSGLSNDHTTILQVIKIPDHKLSYFLPAVPTAMWYLKILSHVEWRNPLRDSALGEDRN